MTKSAWLFLCLTLATGILGECILHDGAMCLCLLGKTRIVTGGVDLHSKSQRTT